MSRLIFLHVAPTGATWPWKSMPSSSWCRFFADVNGRGALQLRSEESVGDFYTLCAPAVAVISKHVDFTIMPLTTDLSLSI